MNQKHLKYICTELQLGSPIGIATNVFGSRGGSLMWRVNTEKGSYAIKQLAPVIDLKNEKMVTKYELSENIASRFAQHGIPAVCALEHAGKRLFLIENIGYLGYPWIEGTSFGRYDTSEPYALKIAALLAKLQNIHLNVPEADPPRFDVYENDTIVSAIDKAVSLSCPFAIALKENQDLILSMNDRYHTVIHILKEDTVITHGDLDQLNVLWDKSGQPFLIDWESTRRMNPTRDIIRTSLSWSCFNSMSSDDPSFSLYGTMLTTYHQACGMLNKNHIDAALNSVVGSLVFWMLYNINIACTSSILEERDIAVKEVNEVLIGFFRLNKFFHQLLLISVAASCGKLDFKKE